MISGSAASRLLGRTPGAESAPGAPQQTNAAPSRTPDQLASSAAPARARRVNGASRYFEFQVETQAATVPGSLTPTYPEVLKFSGGGGGQVTAQFVVDTSANDLFSQAAKDGVSKAKFYPAGIGGKKVKQLVQLPFTFTLSW